MIELKITDTATADGEPVSVKADSRDVCVWEKTDKQGRAAIATILGEQRMADLYRLGHIAAKRQQLVQCGLQEFEARFLIEFDVEDELVGADVDDEPDPTGPAA